MMTRRSGLASLGLAFFAALCLLAFVAATAQAGEFKIGGKTFTELKIESEAVLGEGNLSLNVMGGVPVSCTVFLHGTIFKEGLTHETFNFKECSVEKLACTVTNSFTFLVVGTVFLHGGRAYYRLVPASGSTFAEIEFSGEECPLAEVKSKFTGSFVGRLGDALPEHVTQITLFTEPIELLFSELVSTELLFGNERATVFGTLLPQLWGANKGKEWEAE